MLRHFRAAVIGLGLTLAATAAFAQPAPRPVVSKDPAAAPAGVYKLDPEHTSLLARIAHQAGISWTVVRFGGVSGSLTWEPTAIERSKLQVTVEAKSLNTPIKFVEDLMDERFLDSAKYPTMTFVSTEVRRTGPTTGQISGNFTFRGVTKPIVIEGELVGAGAKADRTPAVGFHGAFKFKRSDYGFTFALGSIGDEIEIVTDLEFLGPKPPPAPPAT